MITFAPRTEKPDSEVTRAKRKDARLEADVDRAPDPAEHNGAGTEHPIETLPINALLRAVALRRARRMADSNGGGTVNLTPSGGGKPLDEKTRKSMQPAFGHDFSAVRVHDDPAAAKVADALNADALTVGRDIYFGAGQYQPQTGAGQRLVAHELAHTVQFDKGRVTAANAGSPAGSPETKETKEHTPQPPPHAGARSASRRTEAPEPSHTATADQAPAGRGELTGRNRGIGEEPSSAIEPMREGYFTPAKPGRSPSLAAEPAGGVAVSSPGDALETEAESAADAAIADMQGHPEKEAAPGALGVPETPSRLVTPAPAGMILRKPRNQQRERPSYLIGDDTKIVYEPDMFLFDSVSYFKGWDILKPTFVPLAGGTFIVDGIPISFALQGQASARSSAGVTFGPGLLRDIWVFVTGPEAERMRTPKTTIIPGFPPIILQSPPHRDPHGKFSAGAYIQFSAVAAGLISADARLEASLGLFLNALNAGVFAGLNGAATATARTNVNTFIDFTWHDGSVSVTATLDFTAALNLAFHLAAYAGVWVELRVPEIPVVTNLTHEVQDWPIVGWFVPDLTKWKWRKEYKKDWPIFSKRYNWDLEQQFIIKSGSAAAKFTNAQGFGMEQVLADLQGHQKQGDLKDDPEGPGKERRNSDTGALSAARAGALAQISSAKRAAEREKKANARLLTRVKRAAAAAAKKPSAGTAAPSLAITTGGGSSDPVTDVEKRDEKLDKAVKSTDQLRKRADDLQEPASAPDGVSRNEARAGFESIAKNADALGDKLDNEEGEFAVPAAAEPNDADYPKMRDAMHKAYAAFDECFDPVRTEKLYADDQVNQAGSDADLHAYRDAAVLYQGRALVLWNRVQKLESDLDKAREFYEKGDYAAGAAVFDELENKAIHLKEDGEALTRDRPVRDWDTDYVELSGGHLMLMPQYRGKATRSYFYPHDYSAATKSRMMTEIGSFRTDDQGTVYWNYSHRKSPRGDFWWLLNDELEQPTLDHTSPTVLGHWNTSGRKTTYDPRFMFYDFTGAPLIVVPKTLNSSAGGREPDSYTPRVTRAFRGSKT